MSKSINSPTARLLQSSRLFSLPRPLPQPATLDTSTSDIFRRSDTATQPYPTHQAITTPASSLSRGDWGLKRALPAKTTQRTSTPHIRVRAQDTYEHITDFASAADHTLNAAKWAEMGVPMVVRGSRGSVYENGIDSTDPEVKETRVMKGGQEVRTPVQRWKYEGPWIGGMQEGEFRQWLDGVVGKRRGEWREFLRKEEHAECVRREEQRRRAAAWEKDPDDPIITPLTASEVEDLKPTDSDLTALEKRLRDDHRDELSSDLTGLLTRFLDLPSIYIAPTTRRTKDQDFLSRVSQGLGSNTDFLGPPTTHPAAGLSHLRSNAIMPNHPIHGPQAHRTPIQARVVKPRVGATGGTQRQTASIGVGGFVANDSQTATYKPGGRVGDAVDPAHMLQPESDGGGKVWVDARSAFIDERGRVVLDTMRADHEAVKVRLDEVEEIHAAKAASSSPAPMAAAAGPTRMAGRAPESRMRGYDEEMRRWAQKQQRRQEQQANVSAGAGAEGREDIAKSMREAFEKAK